MVLNIICFLWYGDRWNKDDMGIQYVNRLHEGVQKHLSKPHRFYCMTTETHRATEFDHGIELIELQPPCWMGCLPKLVAFDPRYGFTDQVLLLDIDLIIVGSLDDIASYRGDLCVRSKFKPGEEWKADGDIIGFKPGQPIAHKIWNTLKENPKRAEEITGGRERYWFRYITNHQIDRWQTLFPGQIVSYKRHVQPHGGRIPDNARIVSCHGRPRPHELPHRWAKAYWDGKLTSIMKIGKQ